MKDRLVQKAGSVCSTGGSVFCNTQPHTTICVVDGNDFRCACVDGYKPVGINASSACTDIDECKTGQQECHLKIADSVCVNTDGSYQCICDQYRRLSGVTCVDKNECLENNGDCGENANCFNQIGAPPVCKCKTGYSGYSDTTDEEHIGCIDLDECSQSDAETICPENASCVNTVGSYRCNCDPGYTMTADSKCEPVDLCAVQKNDCDPYFADCIQSGGTATCYCKAYFTGSGKSGDCVPMTGYENLACTLEGTSCTSYEECTRNIAAGTYSCEKKGTLQQLAVFFSEGASSDTPFWVWSVVILGVILLCFAVVTTTRRALRKTRESSEASAVPTDIVYGYGATDYYI
ncbi:UNVERIFIED_CONTAM: calcium binding egf domain-containing protein [Hammondia hammondi]|eukprot:XP_008883396.1 calcium binding egf domain-containing protein [Hammondia hammondi]